MAYTIIGVESEHKNKIGPLLKDDIVSRQSITRRDARAFGLEQDTHFILIEGDSKAIERANQLFQDIGKVLTGSEAEEIYNKFKSEEAEVATGVGFIFGR